MKKGWLIGIIAGVVGTRRVRPAPIAFFVSWVFSPLTRPVVDAAEEFPGPCWGKARIAEAYAFPLPTASARRQDEASFAAAVQRGGPSRPFSSASSWHKPSDQQSRRRGGRDGCHQERRAPQRIALRPGTRRGKMERSVSVRYGRRGAGDDACDGRPADHVEEMNGGAGRLLRFQRGGPDQELHGFFMPRLAELWKKENHTATTGKKRFSSLSSRKSTSAPSGR